MSASGSVDRAERVVHRAYFFGVEDPRHLGHGFVRADGTGRFYRPLAKDERPEKIVPWGYAVDSQLMPRSEVQGAALLHHMDGWTCLSMADRTGDTRGNSNANFIFEGTLDFEQAVAEATRLFPTLVARIGPITQSTDAPKGRR